MPRSATGSMKRPKRFRGLADAPRAAMGSCPDTGAAPGALGFRLLEISHAREHASNSTEVADSCLGFSTIC